jgi:exopolyphosphatase/pppGpp-phosphohydrolase
MRLAVIEVGSRGVRLLVAEAEGDRLGHVASAVENLDLMRLLKGEGAKTALSRLRPIVDRFRNRANSLQADRTMVFGTEAMRRVSLALGGGTVPGIRILTPADEALCALAAGCGGGLPHGSELCVLDLGNGSVEAVRGRAAHSLEMDSFRSLPLGGDQLVDRLRSLELKAPLFRDWANAEIDRVELSGLKAGNTVVLGTVATKCAWLAVRGRSTNYDPARVDGYVMNTGSLAALIKYISDRPSSRWREVSEFINPGDRAPDVVERMLSGCIVLEILLSRLGQSRFRVGAYGTRFGFARLVAGGLFPEAQVDTAR